MHSADDTDSETDTPRSSVSSVSQIEFLRGSLAAATNTIITFPLNKIVARQAFEGLTFVSALATVRSDGIRYLYRGVLPPLLQRCTSSGLMFAGYDFWFHRIRHRLGREDMSHCAATDVKETWFVRSSAAVLTGSTEVLLSPFERVQALLQHRHYTKVFSNTWDAGKAVMKLGIREMYRGMSAIVVRSFIGNLMFFTCRDSLKNMLPERNPLRLRGLEEPVKPIDGELITVEKHSRVLVQKDETIFSERKIRRTVLETSPPPFGIVTNGVTHKDPLYITKGDALWDGFRNFVTGAVLGASISTVLYPLNTAKLSMQTQIGTPYIPFYKEIVRLSIERGGFKALFRGVAGNGVRSLMSWGIVNTTYEYTKKWTYQDD